MKILKIVICGSMVFREEMQAVKAELNRIGHWVIFAPGDEEKPGVRLPPISEKASRKVALDVYSLYMGELLKADAILCYNKTKPLGDMENYIGANSFLELGFAAALKKRIFFLFPVPKFPYLAEELEAMSPIVLNGDLKAINLHA